jgi:DNA-binding transcriptional LysR family regulator
MSEGNLDDLVAFLASRGKAVLPARTPSSGYRNRLSVRSCHSLEERLGVWLLTRTTRRVSPTDAGERLFATAGPRIDEINVELAMLNELRDRTAGAVRIRASDHALQSIFWPKLATFLSNYPDTKVELAIDYGLTDIFSERYDAGVRLGEQVAKDMIAVRIGPDFRFAAGRIRLFLDELCDPWPGYHLFYPSRRQASLAIALLVEELRYRE